MKKKKPVTQAKKDLTSVIVFAVGHFFIMLSTFSVIATFKIIPRWVELFTLSIIPAVICFFIALLRLHKRNRPFFLALVTDGIMLTVRLVTEIAATSMDGFYHTFAQSLPWASQAILLTLYITYIQGSYLLLKDKRPEKNMKKLKNCGFAFFLLTITGILVQIIALFPFVKNNILANNIFTYGGWGFSFAEVIFAMLICINVTIGIHNIRKEELTNETKVEELSK